MSDPAAVRVAPPNRQVPSGLGMLVWQLKLCEGGDLGRMAARAAESGVGWVSVKAGDDGVDNGQINQALFTAFGGVGVQVYAWVYSTPSAWRALVAQARRLSDMGIAGVMPDCEEWWEQSYARDPAGNVLVDANGKKRIVPANHHGDAAEFAAALRAAVAPQCFLGDVGAWQWPRYHPIFPDVEFGAAFDARMPERYWANFDPSTTFDHALDESEREWAALPPAARPMIIPIGSAFDDRQPSTDAQILRFVDRYPTCGLWSWQHVRASTWAMLRARAAVPEAPPSSSGGKS